MPNFPNERPIPPHDLIGLAEDGHFGDFEDALQDGTPAAARTVRRDYVFTMAGPNGHIIVARPTSAHSSTNPWAKDINTGEWLENASYDPSTGSLDESTCPNYQAPVAVPAGAPGTCVACGNAPALAGGGVPAFCPSCGAPMLPARVAAAAGPVGGHAPAVPPGANGPAGPFGLPIGGMSHPTGHNPNRMEGRPQKEVVVPDGMKAVSKPTGFEDALDALLAQAEENPTP